MTKLKAWVSGRIGRWGPVLAWMVLIFGLSAQPRLPSPENRLLDFLFEKSAHTAEFAMLGALLSRALTSGEVPGRRALGQAVLLAWLYALSDEYHQSFVPGRSADWLDVFFDFLGTLLGVGVWWGWRTARRT